MAKPDRSPLVDAALAFDEQLAAYARLQQTGKVLIEALTAARNRQEELSAQVVAHAPALQARNTRLRELMTAMGELASDVAQVNAQVIAPAGADQRQPDPAEVSAAVLAVSGRAEALAQQAHDAEFEELSAQAHALHQRLQAIASKLQKAAGN